MKKTLLFLSTYTLVNAFGVVPAPGATFRSSQSDPEVGECHKNSQNNNIKGCSIWAKKSSGNSYYALFYGPSGGNQPGQFEHDWNQGTRCKGGAKTFTNVKARTECAVKCAQYGADNGYDVLFGYCCAFNKRKKKCTVAPNGDSRTERASDWKKTKVVLQPWYDWNDDQYYGLETMVKGIYRGSKYTAVFSNWYGDEKCANPVATWGVADGVSSGTACLTKCAHYAAVNRPAYGVGPGAGFCCAFQHESSTPQCHIARDTDEHSGTDGLATTTGYQWKRAHGELTDHPILPRFHDWNSKTKCKYPDKTWSGESADSCRSKCGEYAQANDYASNFCCDYKTKNDRSCSVSASTATKSAGNFKQSKGYFFDRIEEYEYTPHPG